MIETKNKDKKSMETNKEVKGNKEAIDKKWKKQSVWLIAKKITYAFMGFACVWWNKYQPVTGSEAKSSREKNRVSDKEYIIKRIMLKKLGKKKPRQVLADHVQQQQQQSSSLDKASKPCSTNREKNKNVPFWSQQEQKQPVEHISQQFYKETKE